jgi:HEAT repeat protein
MRTHKPEKNRPLARFLFLFVFSILPALCLSCGKEGPPRLSSSQAPSLAPSPEKRADAPQQAGEREQWFWRDRLSVRPEPLSPPTAQAGLAEEVDALFADAEEVAPNALENRIAALSEKGSRVVPFLADRAKKGATTVRFLAAAALGRIGDAHAQEPLLHLLRDGWSTSAIVAADSLAESGEPWIMPRLIKTLGPYPVEYNPWLMVRVKAAGGLIRLGNYSGVPFLIAVLKENTPAEGGPRRWDKTQRIAWEKEVALSALAGLTGDTFGFCVDAARPDQAAAALKFEKWWLENRVGLWHDAPALTDPLLLEHVRALVDGLSSYQIRNKDGAQFVLQNLGPPVFPFLAEALNSDSFYVKYHALATIGAVADLAGDRSESWSGKTAVCLGDKRGAVRSQACRTLGCLGRTSSIPPLEKLFVDPDGDVRLKAVEAVGLIGGEAGTLALRSLLSEAEPGQLRVEILAALARLSPGDVDAFVAEFLADAPSRQDWALQKVIAITGSDFSFPLDGSAAERKTAAGKIRSALLSLDR